MKPDYELSDFEAKIELKQIIVRTVTFLFSFNLISLKEKNPDFEK